ncbi:MAG: hypothetical protein HKN92_08475 [Chitinophagales bacterium]|nr:hypothetical protein [Chitinophagales bacterium]
MEQFGAYTIIIAASVVIIVSFMFGTISRRTNVPSVLLLIALGIGLQYLLKHFGAGDFDFFPYLEVLGIVGLIMIVLEAALDLKLQRDKIGVIIKSFLIAAIGLGFSVSATAFIIYHIVTVMTWAECILYATPISILSSAIIIPSVTNLVTEKKEFHIYESTFSDILGIMLFYFLIEYLTPSISSNGESSNAVGSFLINLVITIGISLIASYVLLFVFQNIKEKAKLFVLISVLLLLYAVAKKFHLSPLIIILVFGLAVSNSKLFFRGWFKKMLHPERFKEMEHGLHGLTLETAFVVRTFFFVIFGTTIVLSSIFSFSVFITSIAILISIYFIRWLSLIIFYGRNITPQLWIAPRGLITVLLYYAIPVEFQSVYFDPGILLFIIIATGVIMTMGLIADKMNAEEAAKKAELALLKKEADLQTGLEAISKPIEVEEKKGPRIAVIEEVERSKFQQWIHDHITSNPRFLELKTKFRRLAKIIIRGFGIQPIFNPENKILGKRIQTVLWILRNPGNVDLKENEDYKNLKKYVHKIIFGTDSVEGFLFDILLLITIILSVIIVMLESVKEVNMTWGPVLRTADWIITIMFTVEYFLRIWTTKNSKKYIFSFFGIIDLLAIIPLYFELLFTGIYSVEVIRVVRLLRIFRVLRLAHFMEEAEVLIVSLKKSLNKIFVFLFFVIIICTVVGSLMFIIEGPEQGFTSIPRGIYWAVVTLTTVGYGDIHPVSGLGQFLAMLLMVVGYGVIAVPTGLVAADAVTTIKLRRQEEREQQKAENQKNTSGNSPPEEDPFLPSEDDGDKIF